MIPEIYEVSQESLSTVILLKMLSNLKPL